MELRPILLPPSHDEAVIGYLTDLATRIVNAIDTGKDATALIDEFNAAADCAYDSENFISAVESMDLREYVIITLSLPPSVPDITDAEYIELITRLMDADGSESEQHFWLGLLERNLGCPLISDFIYWPEEEEGEMTPEEVLRKAREYKPIAM